MRAHGPTWTSWSAFGFTSPPNCCKNATMAAGCSARLRMCTAWGAGGGQGKGGGGKGLVTFRQKTPKILSFYLTAP